MRRHYPSDPLAKLGQAPLPAAGRANRYHM
jgi:hypothetical protein